MSLLVVPALACKPSKESLRFGLLADSHYAQKDDWKNRRYDQSLAKTEEAVRVMNEEQVDFLLHLGDFKDEGNSPNREETLGFLDEIETVFQGFEGPTYHAIGNHDLDSISKQQFLGNIENTGIPSDKGYYSFDKKNVHFIILDANFHPDGRHHNNGDFQWYESHLPDEELNWLEQDLAATTYPSVVFIHHTLHDMNVGDHPYHVDNSERIRQILEQSDKVLAVFEGHYHQEYHTQINQIHYYILPALVEQSGLKNNAFAIASVYPNGDIEIEGYKRVNDMDLRKTVGP